MADMTKTHSSIATDSEAELRNVIGDDATATFEEDPTFIDSNPTESASSQNVAVQRDEDDTEDSEEEIDEEDEEEDDLDEDEDEDDAVEDDEEDEDDEDGEDEEDPDTRTDKVADTALRMHPFTTRTAKSASFI
jgi:hypothetical protein